MSKVLLMPLKSNSLQDQYHAGKISAGEFLDKLLNSRDGDRRRRKAEERFEKIAKGVGRES